MIALTALVCAALFAGSALLASLAETPVKLQAMVHGAPAFAGGVLGIAAWYRWQSNWFWLAGGVVLLAGAVLALLPRSRQRDHGRTAVALLATGLIWYGLAGS